MYIFCWNNARKVKKNYVFCRALASRAAFRLLSSSIDGAPGGKITFFGEGDRELERDLERDRLRFFFFDFFSFFDFFFFDLFVEIFKSMKILKNLEKLQNLKYEILNYEI